MAGMYLFRKSGSLEVRPQEGGGVDW